MSRLPRMFAVMFALLAGSAASAITIELDYTYDSNGFFDQLGSKEALRVVADFFEARLHDNLLEINQNTFGSGNSWSARFTHPGTGVTQSVAGLIVPEDTIIVYVGGRALGGAAGLGGPGGYSASGFSDWFDRLDARGQAGELEVPATDFGPWGGSISFDTGRSWHFQMDSRPASSVSDFVSVALHEFGHVLGIGTSAAWDAQIDVDDLFNGVRSVEAFGRPVPVDPSWGHWQDDGACTWPLGYDPDNALNVLSLTHVSFGTAHGGDQIALMDPSSCTITSVTSLKVFTDLDLAGLSDVGWEVFHGVELTVPALGPALASFSWPSTTGQSYTLQRSTDLSAGWGDLVLASAGDGQTMTFSDTTPPAGQAFYRLLSDPAAEPEALAFSEAFADAPLEAEVLVGGEAPRTVDGCGLHAH